jgi:hypothetical protein
MENQPPIQPTQYSSNPQMPLPNGTATLVLGIISIVGCFCYGTVGLICGIIALVLYGKDKRLYAANPSAYTPGSYGNLKSGRICAIIGLSLSAVYLVVIIIYLIIFGAAILSHPQEIFHHMNNY